jgi:hypothetical protein
VFDSESINDLVEGMEWGMDLVYLSANGVSSLASFSPIYHALKPMSMIIPVVSVCWNVFDAVGTSAVAKKQAMQGFAAASRLNYCNAAQLLVLTVPQFVSLFFATPFLISLGSVMSAWSFTFSLIISCYVENLMIQQCDHKVRALISSNSEVINAYLSWKKQLDRPLYSFTKRKQAKQRLIDHLAKSTLGNTHRSEILRHVSTIEKSDQLLRVWLGCTVTIGLLGCVTTVGCFALLGYGFSITISIAALAWAVWRLGLRVESTALRRNQYAIANETFSGSSQSSSGEKKSTGFFASCLNRVYSYVSKPAAKPVRYVSIGNVG